MSELEFGNLLGVAAIAFFAPFVLGLAPGLRLPAVVLELVLGIVVGPDVLGWVTADEPVQVLALVGLAMLLFLAGLEVDTSRLRGPLLRVAGGGFLLTLVLAVGVGAALLAAGEVDDPLFVAVVLSATSLGVVVPVLEDAGLARAPFGQLVLVAAAIADVATVVLLTLLASGEGGSLLLVAGLAALAGLVVLVARTGAHVHRISAALDRLESTSAQLRVRAAVLLLVGFVAFAQALGLELILGAFVAGGVLSVLDPERRMAHPELRRSLTTLGFGFLIPVFFVSSGLRFDLDALTADSGVLVLVPLLALALLVVRGIPALVYRRLLADRRQVVAAGLLQATTLPFVVAATAIGVDIGALEPGIAAALIAAGLLSVLVFPLVSVSLLTAHPAGEQDAPSGGDGGTIPTGRGPAPRPAA